jgi:hypothetical protein
MPRRRRTRRQDRAERIRSQRRLNEIECALIELDDGYRMESRLSDTLVAERNRPPPF